MATGYNNCGVYEQELKTAEEAHSFYSLLGKGKVTLPGVTDQVIVTEMEILNIGLDTPKIRVKYIIPPSWPGFEI